MFIRVLVIVGFGIALAAALTLAREPKPAAPLLPVVIAVGKQPLSALIYVAMERGYFRDEGLAVELRSFSSGRDAFAALERPEVDLATVGEMPFISALRQGKRLATVATIESSDRNNFIVARSDRGISRPRDLIGSRIGIVPGTSSEVFLNAFLITHAIPLDKVERIHLRTDELRSSLAEGRVDAVSVWALDAALLRKQLGKLARQFDEEGLYIHNWMLAGRTDTISQKRDLMVGVLRALVRAEDEVSDRPEYAIPIVARTLGIDADLLSVVWSQYHFSVGLHQYLLINLENHARMIRRHDYERELNFFTALRLEPLIAIDPARVTAIH